MPISGQREREVVGEREHHRSRREWKSIRAVVPDQKYNSTEGSDRRTEIEDQHIAEPV